MMSNCPMFIRGVAQQTEKADKNADGMVHGVHGSLGKSSDNTFPQGDKSTSNKTCRPYGFLVSSV